MNSNHSSFINHDFLYHDIRHKAFQELFRKKDIFRLPFITVSREPGSGGSLIAKRLANHLNYRFYDKDLINRMYQSQTEANEYLEHYDEKEISLIDEFITSFVHPNLISQDKFVKVLINFIIKLSLKGKCVILGRGANFFTDHKLGFHVRITAPFNYRVSKTMQYEKMSEKKALERVREVSGERKHFVEKYFSRHIDNSEFYDLVLNREHFSLEDSVNLILHAFKKKLSSAPNK